MNRFTLDITKIKNKRGAEKQFSAAPDLGSFELREQNIELGVVNISGKGTNVGDGILLQATVNGPVILTCSRCLDKFKHPLSLELNELYPFKDEEAEHAVENETIDIATLVVEFVSLNLDIRVLCKKDCAGLCPSCGINLNKEPCDCKKEKFDIRWHKLDELKRRLKDVDR